MKNKKNFELIKKFLFGIILCIPFLIEKFTYSETPILWPRLFLNIAIFLLLGLHAIIPPKKLWNFIYKKRYALGIFLFVFCVINGYHGSSLSVYNDIIEPSTSIKEGTPFWGKARSIRSDEYAVDTPALLSQITYNPELSITNDALMARKNYVTIFPQLPTKSIGILTNQRLIGFLFLDREMGYSFYWLFPWFVMSFSLFELFMIITKKKKLYSLLGTILLVLGPPMLWWNSTPFLLYGSLAFHMFRHFLISDSWKKKLIYAILLGWFGSCYIMIVYPAWQILYGYVFLALFIWQLFENKDHLKWKDLLYFIPLLIVIGILVIPPILFASEQIDLLSGTIYPGKRNMTGGDDWARLFTYIPSIFFGVSEIGNPCEYSQFLSLFPLPILLGIYQAYCNFKKKKNNVLLNSLLVITILLTIFNFFSIPILSKIMFLYMSPGARTAVVIGVLCIFLTIILLSEYEVKKINNKKAMVGIFMAIILVFLGIYVSRNHFEQTTVYNKEYLSNLKSLVSGFVFLIWMVLFTINYNKWNKFLAVTMIIAYLLIGMTVHPISKGLSVIYEKPVAKEIKKIAKEDPKAIWIVIGDDFRFPGFVLANGVRVLNSVNYFPNMDLWKKLDNKKQYEDIYNRYAHIFIELVDQPTSFELIQTDLVKLNLNKQDICRNNIDYIYSTKKLDYKEVTVYEGENTYIYKTNCN